MVQQIVEYARSQAVSNIEQGIDVLRSGLSMQAEECKGSDSASLLLGIADLEFERSNWSEMHTMASKSMAAAAAAGDSDLQVLAGSAAARALLVQGEPDVARVHPASARGVILLITASYCSDGTWILCWVTPRAPAMC